MGQALSRSIAAVAADIEGPVWLIADHNGETNRAMEFGNLLARTAGPGRTFAPPLFPAASFGVASLARADAAPVDPKDPTAVQLGYVTDATKADKAKIPKYAAGQECGNCGLYQGAAGSAQGPGRPG